MHRPACAHEYIPVARTGIGGGGNAVLIVALPRAVGLGCQQVLQRGNGLPVLYACAVAHCRQVVHAHVHLPGLGRVPEYAREFVLARLIPVPLVAGVLHRRMHGLHIYIYI